MDSSRGPWRWLDAETLMEDYGPRHVILTTWSNEGRGDRVARGAGSDGAALDEIDQAELVMLDEIPQPG